MFALIQEPYVGSEGELRQKMGFRVVQKIQNRAKPVKSAIVIFKDDIEVIEYPSLTTENMAVAVLKTNTWKLGVISIYFEGALPIEPYLTHLKSVVTKLGTDKLIIGGDANAWSPWWGSDEEDHRGEAMAGAIDEMEMNVLNEGTVPTFFTVRNDNIYKSIVDVTVCSHQLLGDISDWKVDQEMTSSDHNAITFTIKLRKHNIEPRKMHTTRKFNTKKANWEKFREILKINLEENCLKTLEIEKVTTEIALEAVVEKYTLSIENACKGAIPPIAKKIKSSLPWWSPKLEDMKRQMTTRKRRIRCAAPSRRQHVVDQYLKAKEEYELEAAKAQIESWKEFCGTQERESMWDGIYRVIRSTAKKSEDQPLVKEGRVQSLEQSTKYLAETFFPVDVEKDDNSEHKVIREKAKDINKPVQGDSRDPPFTREELQYVVETFNPKKAPGSDGFTADICAEAIHLDLGIYLAIANRCLELSYFPAIWKQAVVIVLRKPGKPDYTHVKSYRPIGLLPVLGKILEKMIVRRVRWHMLPKACPKQYGFVPQRSTEDSLYDLVQHIRKNVDSKLISVVVSLDIEGAFDSAWWPAIKCQLTNKKCPLNLRRTINSYLEDRKVSVRYAGKEYNVSTSKGCIQGSIAGPTFWNILLDPLLEETDSSKVYCQAFADDIVLVFSDCSTAVINEKANQVLNRVYEWGAANKLKFAPHKTSAMVITKKLKYDTPHIHMGGTEIQLVQEIKILGLILDSKLTFNSHVKYICTKVLNIYKPLARSAKINWGLSAEVIRTIYVSVIEPIVLYAASAWAPAAEKLTVQKHLNAVQRGFALKIIKAYRTVSLPAALVLAGLVPLDLRVQEAAKLYLAKRGRPQRIIADKVVERRKSFLEAPHPAHEIQISFEKLDDLDQLAAGTNGLEGLQIFTDGSKIDGRVGAALTCWKNGRETAKQKFLLEPFCSVYQAEMYALYRATELAIKSKETLIQIYSDSRSSLETIKNINTYNPLSFDIRQNLIKLNVNQKTVKLFWIRAHVGFEGNERADQLAKEAALTKKTAPDYDACPISFIKGCLKQESLTLFQKRYSLSGQAKITKLFFPDVKLAFAILNKIKLTHVLVQALTGHGGFAEYLHRFKCKDTPGCVCDETQEESIVHLLIDCPQHAAVREDLQQEMQMNLCRETVHVIMATASIRDSFLKYASRIVRIAIRRNRTDT